MISINFTEYFIIIKPRQNFLKKINIKKCLYVSSK